MLCENCNINHNGIYGSGRFCSKECARSFSTKDKRADINKKVSDKLSIKFNGITKQQKIQRDIAYKHASFLQRVEVTTLYDLSSRTVAKILKRMNLPCSFCGWHVDNVICDIHHIIEKKNGGSNEHTNLSYICPNCHRLVHSNKIKPSDLITLHDYIGDEWKKYYFVKLIE